jgi:hypothetical protein
VQQRAPHLREGASQAFRLLSSVYAFHLMLLRDLDPNHRAACAHDASDVCTDRDPIETPAVRNTVQLMLAGFLEDQLGPRDQVPHGLGGRDPSRTSSRLSHLDMAKGSALRREPRNTRTRLCGNCRQRRGVRPVSYCE